MPYDRTPVFESILLSTRRVMCRTVSQSLLPENLLREGERCDEKFLELRGRRFGSRIQIPKVVGPPE